MTRYWNFVLLCFALCFFQACSFTVQQYTTSIRVLQRHHHSPITDTFLHARRSDDPEDNSSENQIPQLPPAIGAPSFQNNHPPATLPSEQPALVSPKFKLQYTCKVCETRNCHLVSRVAYREGVVIAICKGCESKHLIADNLGTAGLDGDTNIEDYFKARGMEDNVNRVTQEVFELEKILDFDSVGGSLVGDDGKPVLE